MFIKRLELHGFKSFGHKTTIEFMDGVTIVVGPNGCGKSNVLDGIKWVLGETSAKSLRGSKMGDVVFRGSASMKAAHFAQVNLTLNNEAQHLRMDQSEVLVTRRLFSNGDSEYAINKQKGRMRDVHELFLDTGLGADGYSIIEQGQIGQIVAAKPTQRREIFEEAAGISRYKARREETLRKLIRTEEDLVRLYDIVSEVQRSCNSLYRQAKKAIRHRKTRRRLLRLQKRVLVLRRSMLAEKLTKVDATLDAARAEFEAANTKLVEAEARRAESARLLEDYQSRSQELQQERYDQQEAINREQRRIESAKHALESIAERLALLQQEMTSASNRVQVLASTVNALEEDLGRERVTLQKESTTTEEKERRLETLRREMHAANEHTAGLRRALEVERAKQSKVQQDRGRSESLIERLREDLASHESATAKLREEAEQATADAQAARAALENHRAELAKLREEAAHHKSEIEARSQAKNELAAQLDKLVKEYNQAASRQEALEDLEASYEGFFHGVQVVMKASQSGKLNGVIGVMTNLLRVPKEYEIALEVALGGSLQDIVTKSEADAQAAIDLLKRTGAGRATFLPLSLLHTSTRFDHLDKIMGRNGVVGIAKKLIEYDPQIEKAVDRRLGNTVVVDRLPTAVALEREGVRNRYVTLEGELVDPSGVLTGGSHKSRGFLSRSREIHEIRQRVAKLDEQRRELQAKVAEQNDELSRHHARAAELQATMHNTQMAEARTEKDLQSAEARAKDRRNSLATAEARAVQQHHDLTQHEQRIALCQEGLAEIDARVIELESGISGAESTSGGRAGELEKLSDEVSAGRATVRVLGERVTSMEAKIKEVRAENESADSENARRQEEKTRLTEQRGTATTDAAEAEKLLGDLVRHREQIEARLSALTQENEATIRRAREELAGVQGLQRDRNMKENTLREQEMSATELRTQIRVIDEESQNEFGVGVDEIAAELDAPAEVQNDAISAPDGEEDAEAGDEPAEDEAKIYAKDDALTDVKELRELVTELRGKLERMGAVNETAIDEFKEQKERLDFLTAQRDDLTAARDSLTETIKNLDETTARLFAEAYDAIRRNFQENFRRLFNGGKGDLVLVEDEKEPEPGIEIFAQPPGKNIGGTIALMSGGEKAMTAIALMLALFQYKPSPICILDEIDAPLDDVNCQRLCDALKEYARTTQFLIITHNKITMSLADTIYGVTMQEPGISKLVSVKFDQIEQSGLLEGTG